MQNAQKKKRRYSSGSFPKRWITLRRGATEVEIQCTEETLVNFWGRQVIGNNPGKVARFPKSEWEVIGESIR